jgi:hypothetical protein
VASGELRAVANDGRYPDPDARGSPFASRPAGPIEGAKRTVTTYSRVRQLGPNAC